MTGPRTVPLALAPLPPCAADARTVVALSGGLDSTVLLHALAASGMSALHAVHVHHGLQAQADEWAMQCAALCAQFGVPLTILRAQIAADDPAGPEGAARAARYGLLRAELRTGDVLATAHHRDDQAETVLLRLLRGSGVHGLAAMQQLSGFPPGRLWRPLLDVPRAALRAYAEQHRLRWIEDPHNRDPRYTRSWLRAAVVPTLRARFPQADASLARSARLAGEAAELLAVLAAQDAQAIARGAALSVAGLLALPAPRRHNLLRYWLRGQGFEVPFADMLDRVDREMLDAAADAEPLLRWRGCELRRYRDVLHAMVPLPPPPAAGLSLLWADGATLELPDGCGRLDANRAPPQSLRVRWIGQGESLLPAGGSHRRAVKNLFQEAGLPPWLRRRVPVLELEGRPAYIAGVAATAEWRRLVERTGWQVSWMSASHAPVRRSPFHEPCSRG